jgi:hypothetical protein
MMLIESYIEILFGFIYRHDFGVAPKSGKRVILKIIGFVEQCFA